MKNPQIKNSILLAILAIAFFASLQLQKKNAPQAKPSSSTAHVSSVQASSQQVQSSSSAIQTKDSSNKISSSAAVLPPQAKKITVKTANYTLVLNSKGAVIESIVYNGLKNSHDQNPSLFLVDSIGALNFALASIDLKNQIFSTDSTQAPIIELKDKNTKEIHFYWSDSQGHKIERIYTFDGNSLSIKVDMNSSGFEAQSPLTLRLETGLKETDGEKVHRGGFIGTDYFFSEAIFNDGSDVIRKALTKEQVFNEDHGQIQWAGIRRKYIASVIDFAKPTEGTIKFDTIISTSENKNIKGSYRMEVDDKLDNNKYSFKFILLPLEYHSLKSMNKNYEEILWSGYGWFFGADYWFPKLCGFILFLLNKLYALVSNYGIAIIILTLIVRLITTPLTLAQLRSSRLMQAHKPALDKLKEQYKDPRKYQEQVMAYYKENGINPFGQVLGCFPALLQMPIFISLFIVLGRSVELRNAQFFGWINDLSSPDLISEAIKIPYIMPAGLSILPFIMAITSYFQTKQTITDPNMKMMVWMMPTMMFVFSGLMPSGLVVYWIVSNLYAIAQYNLVSKPKLVDANAALIQGKKNWQASKKKS